METAPANARLQDLVDETLHLVWILIARFDIGASAALVCFASGGLGTSAKEAVSDQR